MQDVYDPIDDHNDCGENNINAVFVSGDNL
jgi:hypothetical protein